MTVCDAVLCGDISDPMSLFPSSILKSLVYFEDAEQDAMPRMIHKVQWNSVKQFFINEQKSLSKQLFNIYVNPKSPKLS